MWFFMPGCIFKINDMIMKPDDKDEEDNLKYETWTQKQYEEEEEEDDD